MLTFDAVALAEQALALMTAYTGVRIDEQWLIRAPKRGVPRSKA
ncbi:hypothetical protein [Streptomyces sp. M2CJ-2]|nr:hypothetical protein [Streptomyces sp. M2CJ-2]